MNVQLIVQSTPNPNALKFILSVPVKTEGKATYRSLKECESNPLAGALFTVANVTEVYFFDNYITITQDGNADWDELEEQIKAVILAHVEQHYPNFKVKEVKKETPVTLSPEVAKIDEILDRTVRPALQMDGGDLQVVNLEGNVVKIHYQGACGSCPSSTMGTLKAIENLLREEYDPQIVVELAEN